MKLRNIKLIAILGTFLISFLSHFIYKFFPNILFSFFFPVNESIFEHMKIIYTSTLIYSIIDHLLIKKNKISYHNYLLQLAFISILSIPLYLTMYLPIYHQIGEHLIISLLLLIITYTIAQLLSYTLADFPPIKNQQYIAIFLIIITYIIFIILTYSPPHIPLFYDTLNNHYGIKKLISNKSIPFLKSIIFQ